MLPAFSEEQKAASTFVLPPITQVINNANEQILELSLHSCEDQFTELNIPSDDLDMDNFANDTSNLQFLRVSRSRSRS